MINPPLSVGADDSTPMTIDTEGDRSTELPSTEEFGPSGVSATTQTAGYAFPRPAARALRGVATGGAPERRLGECGTIDPRLVIIGALGV